MKSGKRPTLRQKRLIASIGLNAANWLVERDSATTFELIHRFTGRHRIIPKGHKDKEWRPGKLC